jgi:hypothetical protein
LKRDPKPSESTDEIDVLKLVRNKAAEPLPIELEQSLRGFWARLKIVLGK